MEDCLFCGLPAPEKFLDDEDKKETWSWACLTSICALFRIQPSDPLQQQLGESSICASCRQLVRDMDWSLRLLDKVLRQVEQLQEQALAKVETNWGRNTKIRKNNETQDELLMHLVKKFRAETAAVNVGMERFKILLNLGNLNQKRQITKVQHPVKNCLPQTQPNKVLEDDKSKIKEEDTDVEIKLEVGLDEDSFTQDFDSEGGRDMDVLATTINMKDSPKIRDIHTRRKHKSKDTSQDEQPSKDSDWEAQDEIDEIEDEDDYLEEEDLDDSDDSDYNDNYSPSTSTSTPKKIPKSIKLIIPCPICQHPCASEAGLTIHHLKTHEKNDHSTEEKHPCNLCGLDLSTTEQLQAHEVEHQSMELPFTCTVCGVVAPNSARLKQHVSITHTKESGKYLCDLCGVKFISYPGLKSHRKMHAELNNAKNKCTDCGRVFPTKAALKIHSFKHSATKSSICDICGKGFVFPASLKRHRVSHDQVYSQKCNICGKLFSHKQFLLKHELIHSGLKCYDCRFCGKQFKTSANKWQHENTHCPNRPNKEERKLSTVQRKRKTKDTGIAETIDSLPSTFVQTQHFNNYQIQIPYQEKYL